jgi:hypothetical protein
MIMCYLVTCECMGYAVCKDGKQIGLISCVSAAARPGKPVVAPFRPAIFNCKVTTLDPAKFT